MSPILLPTINACLNGLAGLFLFAGWRAIKAGRRDAHKTCMISALACSALFLCTYVTYHIIKKGMVTHYTGEGIWRIIYFTILLTHTPLAAIIVPFCLMAVYHAFHNNFKAHVHITRWLYPVWMYVSITGVLIYLMLYIF